MMLSGQQRLRLARNASVRPISECLEMIGRPEGRQRFTDYMAGKPFPHFEPDPTRPRVFIRIDADGRRIAGRFVNREFRPLRARA